MSLITLVPPGDVVGAITAVANFGTSVAQAITALAEDQSPEGRATAHMFNELFAPLGALMTKLNQKLHIDPEKPEPPK